MPEGISNGNRTSCRPIRSVIILVIKQIGLLLHGGPILLNHLYDYKPNWTPLSPVTITYTLWHKLPIPISAASPF